MRAGGRIAVLCLLPATMLAGCGADQEDRVAATTAPVATTAATTAAVGTFGQAIVPSGRPAENALKLVEALATRDPGPIRAAAALTEPGSTAALYVGFQAEVEQANRDAGKGADRAAERVEAQSDGSIRATPQTPGSRPVTFAGFESTATGRLTSFTVNGIDVSSRLVKRPGASGSGIGARVTMLAGYQSVERRELLLVVKIEPGTQAAMIGISTSTYIGADGRRYPSDTSKSAYKNRDAPAGSAGQVMIAFPGAVPGGSVSVSLSGAKCCDTADVELAAA